MINIHEPHISLLDRLKLLKALSTNWIGYGEAVIKFESALKEYLCLENITTATSATQCLYEIFRLLKNETQKKEIIISSLSFIGIANAAAANDFKISYCDIDPDHLSVSYESLQKKINDNTAGVVIQHYGGRPNYDIIEISKLLKEKGIFLIEDCATVLGGKIFDIHPGSFGDFSVWSFDCMKTITSFDGGAIYCKNIKHLNTIKNSFYFGLSKAGSTLAKLQSNSDEWWILDPISYGTKNVLNNISATLGFLQLKKIKTFINRQKDICNQYRMKIKNPKIKFQKLPQSGVSESYFLFPIYCEKRNELALHLKNHKIFSTFRYFPLHKTNLHKDHKNYLKNTEETYSKMLCIPCHKNLKDKEIQYISKKINEF